MDPLLLAMLRTLHVAAGALWFGAVVFASRVLGPTMKAAGDGARPFMAAMQGLGQPARFMGPVAATAVLSGLLLYGLGGYHEDPFGSAAAGLLTLGAALALGVWLYGLAVGMPLQRRMAALGKQMAAGPTPGQAAEMGRLQARFQRMSKAMPPLIAAVFLLMAGRGIAAAL